MRMGAAALKYAPMGAGALKYAPQLVGVSRKSCLGAITGCLQAADRDVATVAANTVAVSSSADGIRVHAWQAGLATAAVADAVVRSPQRCR